MSYTSFLFSGGVLFFFIELYILKQENLSSLSHGSISNFCTETTSYAKFLKKNSKILPPLGTSQ